LKHSYLSVIVSIYQGHVQLLLNLLTNGMTPQAAVDAPRFCIRDGDANGELLLEEGFSEQVVKGLQEKGHAGKAVDLGMEKQEKMKELLVLKGHDRAMFGRAQVLHV
jgi:gamma-glutamyltranspeptidase/glutathione hydrolase